MQTRAKWLALLALITLSACGTTRRSAAELDTSRQEPAQAPAPQYPYTWRPRQLPREPACYDAAMCYDEKREVCVLHGGRSWWWVSRNTTWIWDGEKWWCEENGFQSEFVHSHAMTFSHETENPLMWGGGMERPYTYENNWGRLDGGDEAPSLNRLALASDPLRQVVVAFGGAGTDHEPQNTMFEIHNRTWKQIHFEGGPGAQYNALFIYEPSVKSCLLVDREATEQDGVRTWMWDGNSWSTRMTKGPQLVLRSAQFLVYDTERKRPVAICQSGPADTYELWELDREQWSKRSTIGAPTYRQGCCAAYDQKRKSLVIHGGGIYLSDVFALDETWLCGSDGNWTCANSPPALRPNLHYSCMCYDPSRRSTVLIEENVWYPNGKTESLYRNEWLWDGVRWSRLDLPPEMPQACRKIAVFDTRRNQLLVWFEDDDSAQLWKCTNGKWLRDLNGDIEFRVQGCIFNESEGVVELFHSVPEKTDGRGGLNRVTSWDGQRIATRTTNGPDPYYDWPSFCFDRSRGVTCVFGTWKKPDRVGVWEFDGDHWAVRDSTAHPGGWSCESYAYLNAIKKSVLFGGGAPLASEPKFIQEHWEWNGSGWCPLQFPIPPPGRSLALMAEDTDRGCLVLFGGVAYRRQYCDTWEYGPDRP